MRTEQCKKKYRYGMWTRRPLMEIGRPYLDNSNCNESQVLGGRDFKRTSPTAAIMAFTT